MKAKKSELLLLCEELGVAFPPNSKVANVVQLVKELDDFDSDFAKSRIEVFVKERRDEF